MDKQLFKELLLFSLRDPAVVEEIRLLIVEEDKPNEVKDKEKKKRIKELEREIEQYEKDQVEKKMEINRLQQISQELDIRLRQMQDDLLLLQKRNHELVTRFQDVEELYEGYLCLSAATVNALGGIFKGNTLVDFICCGVQYDSLTSLWDFMKHEVMQNRGDEIPMLDTIFEYFFHAHNKIYDNPLLEIQKIEIGRLFDEGNYIRGGDSKVSGPISKVILRGFVNLNTGKPIRKSIVQV